MTSREVAQTGKDLCPEHTKRDGYEDGKTLHPDRIAANNYVLSVVDTCDYKVSGVFPAWHGWALREAFLAGISYAQKQLTIANGDTLTITSAVKTVNPC